MANITPIEKNTLSSDFFKNINKNFEELNKETDYSQITTADINDGALTTSKVADGAITESKIKNGSVTESKLATNSVTTDKIADGTIQEKDLSNKLQVKLGNTKRIFVTTSMPTINNIIDIDGNDIKPEVGDIVVLVKGING